jgi:hypothetical protein
VKISAETIERAMSEFTSQEERAGDWRRYTHYELRELENGDVSVYAPLHWVEESDPEKLELYRQTRQAREEGMFSADLASHVAAHDVGILHDNESQLYQPLIDDPGLFLKFAKLAEEGPITGEVMREWVRAYGVLGLDKLDGVAGIGNPRGGPAENAYNFGERAHEAHMALTLWKAAKSPYGPDVETIKKYIIMPEVPHLQSWFAAPKVTVREDEEGREATFTEKSALASPEALGIMREVFQEDAVDRRSREQLGEMALAYVRETMRIRLKEECYQRLYPQKDGTDRLGWGFRSLYGAMLLQMMSVIAYSGTRRVCKAPGCFNIISFEKPKPVLNYSGKWETPRKTHSHKETCSEACRRRYSDHNKGRGR